MSLSTPQQVQVLRDAEWRFAAGAVVDLTPDEVLAGLCQCGCGARTATVRYADASKGLRRGQYRTFLKGHSRRVGRPHFRVTEHGCWMWLRNRQTRGYGIAFGQLAHRWFYEQRFGPIPEGLQIDHLCGNKPCVNPNHLDVVTLQENLRRWREGAT